ncbi:coiled-coil domain-containing protein [Helicobacter labacensis]|uniref:hypothetical protein n=1 Tax=Helicobacter labacensis TaxID=2316079 RepID=UPI001F41C460|nr:hypothetical protein [Helicobacter labacensis]
MATYEVVLHIDDGQGFLDATVHKTSKLYNGNEKTPESKHSIDTQAMGKDILHNPQHQNAVTQNTQLQKDLERANERSGALSKQLQSAYNAIGDILADLGLDEELKKKDLNEQIQEAFKYQKSEQARRHQKALEEALGELASELEVSYQEEEEMANKKRKLKDKIKDLKKEIKDLKGECKDWKEKGDKVSALTQELKDARDEVKRLEGDLDERASKIKTLQEQIKTAKTDYSTLEAQKREAERSAMAGKSKKSNAIATIKP